MVYCENDSLLIANEDRDEVIRQLWAFKLFWEQIHGWLCSVICIFGLITNIMHIIVLTRPTMRTTAVNAILTAVAVCDIGTMGSYFIYLNHFVLYPNPPCQFGFHYGWIVFLLIHVFLSIDLHNTSLWLAVAMALVRLITLRQGRLSSPWHRSARAWNISVLIYVVVLIVCLPNLFVHEIIPLEQETNVSNCSVIPEGDFYTMDVSDAAKGNGCRLFKLNLWVTGIFLKVVPCLLLMTLSSSLLHKLHEAQKKRNVLLDSRGRQRQTDRTTVMLIAILLIFLLTELPQGALAIMSAIYTQDVYIIIYAAFGDILDLLSLINSSANFVLYCAMSSKYRQTFWEVILPDKLYRRFFAENTSVTALQSMAGVRTETRTATNGCNSDEQETTLTRRLKNTKGCKKYFDASPSHAQSQRLLSSPYETPAHASSNPIQTDTV